ncbi:MAG TPA: orotidine-5'-phosphate decarboxylase [Nitrososphaerales archaeon]|nr:orotidine-5'-phosphate decarboxylase [Nitrososphaerales archaeon]
MKLLGDWLESNSRKSGSKIILAADVGGPFETRVGAAASLVSALQERIVAVKVNWHLLLPHGVLGLRELVVRCSDAGLPLIADMKLNDIGATNVEAAGTLFSNGFDAIIANPFVGYRGGMEDLLSKSREMRKGVILLVYMSHAGAREGYGLKVGGEPLYLGFARRTRRWGADGAVVSSKSPSIIREVRSILGREQVILSPGVGFQGGDGRKALTAGADYLIVGRSIVGSRDPVKAVDAMNRELGNRGS